MALFAIEINTIMPSNWTSRSIVQLSYMATKRSLKSFCKPKVKQKISFNCVGISSFHFIAIYSKTDGVTWWIVMVIWWTRYWTQDLVFFSFNLWSYLDIYALYFWCHILYVHWFARCWPYNLLPEQPFGKHKFGGQYSNSHWNTIVVKIVWII